MMKDNQNEQGAALPEGGRHREGMSAAGRAAAERARRRREQAGVVHAADFRAEGEDDDGYDPYSDYMDQLNRSSYEEPEEDPWR